MEAGWRGDEKRTIKDLFGRPLRVALAAWILSRDGQPFYVQEAQRAMQPFEESASGVHEELRRLADYGLLRSFEDGRRLYFMATPSRYWPVFEAAAVACGLVQDSSHSQ